MPLPGYEPFLATILDRPAEDGPRLVYADWLEEQGDADRAEFIRVQIELARLPDDDPRHDRLTDRETSLRERHGEAWRAEIPEWARKGCDFGRGFLEHIIVWRDWRRDYGGALSAAAPVIKLTLQNVDDVVATFSPHPNVRWLSELVVLDDQMSYDGLMKLVNPRSVVASLKALRFMGLGSNFGDTGVNILCLAEGLTNLEHLELNRCAVPARGVQRLTDPDELNYLTKLRRLDLTDNNLESDRVWTLTHSEFAKRLTHLTLNNNEITNDGAQAIVESPYLDNLTHLELDDNHIGDQAAIMLAERFSRLTRLSLARNLLTNAGAQRLRTAMGPRARVTPLAAH